MPQKKKSGKQPQKKKQVVQPQLPKDFGLFFLVSGEIEYNEGDGVKKYAKANAVYFEPLGPGKPEGITARGLAQIQNALQMHFISHYMRSHTAPPEITYATILAVSHLGGMSKDQFYADAPGMGKKGEAPAENQETKEQTLPQAPAEQSLPQAPVESPEEIQARKAAEDAVSVETGLDGPVEQVQNSAPPSETEQVPQQ